MPTAAGQTPGGCPILPANNVWNTPVSTLPVDANSAAYISTIGSSRYLHPDFSSGGGGIPFTIVPGTQPLVSIVFGDGAAQSDPGPYPIPANAAVEQGSDQHVLVVDNTNCILYELYLAALQADGSWTASSGAVFNLSSNLLRPDTWTSADAAGLPILPGLVTYDEVASGVINHALRMTAPHTRQQYIWPARHEASTLTGTQYPPMGQRFRLKASFNISTFPPEVQVILTALKTYGAILADNGSSWYISGAPDPRWNDTNLHTLQQVFGTSMEAVDESSLMVDPNSGQALIGQSTLHSIQLSPTVVPGGTTTTKNSAVLSFAAPTGGITVTLSSSNLAAASVPASVMVPAGAVAAPFTIQAGTVSASTPVTITGFATGVSATATLTVSPVSVSSVAASPASVTGGVSSSGKVTLSGPAPTSVVVALSSSNKSAATVPSSVTIKAGATSGTFTITTLAQASTATSTITGSYGGGAASTVVTVTPPVASSVVLSPATLQGGQMANCYVYISSKAPAAGLVVTLTSSNPSLASVPATVTIASGSNYKYLVITAPAVTAAGTAKISATANGVTKSAVLTVNPAGIAGIALSPTSLSGGASATGTITLGGISGANGTVVNITSSLPAVVSVPATATVPAGAKTVTFPISTASVTASTVVTITIKEGASSLGAKLTVNP